MNRKILIWAIAILAVVGMGLAIESTVAHYAPAEHAFCDINATFSCSTVNSSKYSELFGLSVGIYGTAMYLFFLVAIIFYAKKPSEKLMTLLGAASIIGLAFSAYFTYIEAFVIYAWCLVCVASAITMTLIFISVMWLRMIDGKKKEIKSIKVK